MNKINLILNNKTKLRITKLVILILVAVCGINHSTYAQLVVNSMLVHNSSVNQVQDNGYLQVDETNYPDFSPPSGPSDYPDNLRYEELIARVTFEIDRSSLERTDLVAQRIDLEVELLYEDLNHASHSEIKWFSIEFDPAEGKTELEVSSLEFEDVISLSAEIKDIIVDKSGVISSPTVLNNTHPPVILTTEVISRPMYDFKDFNPPPPSPATVITATPSTDNNTIKVSWDKTDNARWYEVQWMFIDGYTSTPLYNYDFRYNSTNIILPADIRHYHIPNIYPDGFIFCRVRPIGFDLQPNDQFEYYFGDWNAPSQVNTDYGTIDLGLIDPLNNDLIPIAGFETNKNWTQVTAFAEDNKRKSVVTYFDGTLRNRQTVTAFEESLDVPLANRTGTAIVGQTIYDFLGRPAINVLPVPSLDDKKAKLTYREQFNNKLNSTEQYNWKHFDLDITGCNQSQTARMDNASGAGGYYSPGKLAVNYSVNKQYIPDAGGYPFVQTEFTQDNTGRVSRISGVGKDHALTGYDELGQSTGENHETEHYYGKPKDAELFLLFGNDVGDEAHYQKNVMVDANNQVNVSYVDAKGRTIATALAGDPNNSPNLLNVDGSKVQDNANKVLPLIYKSDQKDDRWVYEETFYVPQDGDHTFEYTITPSRFTETCIDPLCYTCVYDMTLSIVNSCGQEQIVGGAINQTVGLLNQGDIVNTSCTGDVSFSLSPSPMTVTLTKGEYTIRKTLTINQMALDEYERLYFASPCVKTLQEFLDEESLLIGKRFCDYKCEDCNQDKQDLQDIIDDQQSSAEEKSEAQRLLDYYNQWCPKLCEETTPCTRLYQQMLYDVSPGGEYAKYEIDAGGNYTSTDIYSVFYTNTSDPNTPYWRNPETTVEDANGNDVVINDYLNPDVTNSVVLIKVVNGYPEAYGGNYSNSSGTTWFSGDGDKFVKPKNLKDIKTFIDLWQPFWAEGLVYAHRESCMWEKCDDINDSYLYDNKLNSLIEQDDPTFKSEGTIALENGYFDPLSYASSQPGGVTISVPANWTWFAVTGTADYDPLLNSGLTTVLAELETNLGSYPNITGVDGNDKMSIWDMLIESMDFYEYTTDLQTYLTDPCLNDVAWYTFRGLYQSAKSLALTTYYENACEAQVPKDGSGNLIKPRRFHYDFEETLKMSSFNGKNNNTYNLSDIVSEFYSSNSNTGAQLEDMTEAQCSTQCDSYKPDWKERMIECVTLSGGTHDDPLSDWDAEMNSLLTEMAVICEGGCDLDHPFGSREYDPANPPATGPKNFEEAIYSRFTYDKGVCDALLVIWPMKYNHDYLAYEQPNSADCACQYTQEYIDAKRLECPDWKPGLEAFDDCACDITGNNTPESEAGAETLKSILLNGSYVMEEYRCNTCKTCDEVYSATLQFLKLDDNHYLYPEQDYLDYLQQNNLPVPLLPDYTEGVFKQRLESYLNLELGMNLSFEDYHSFIMDCMEVEEFDEQVFSQIQHERLFMISQSNVPTPGFNIYDYNTPAQWASFDEDRKINNRLKLDSRTSILYNYSNSTTDFTRLPMQKESWELATTGSGLVPYTMQTQAATQTQLDNIRCNCEEILRAQSYAGVHGMPFAAAMLELYPNSTQTVTEEMKNICCRLTKNIPVTTDPSVPCDLSAYTPGDPWPEEFITNVNIIIDDPVWSVNIGSLADNPCTPQPDPCPINKLVPIDECGCDVILNLMNQFNNNTSDVSQDLYNSYGVTLTPAEVKLLADKCQDAFRAGVGWEDGGKAETGWTLGASWTNSAKQALKRDADFWKLRIPCCLSCIPDCDDGPPPPPAKCGVSCEFIELKLMEFMANSNPYPNSDYDEFSDPVRTSKLYGDYGTDPTVQAWFDLFEQYLDPAISAHVDSECLPIDIPMEALMKKLADCGNPCPVLGCASLEALLTEYLQTNPFPADIGATGNTDTKVFDNLLAEYEYHLRGGNSSYNMTDITNWLNGFMALVDGQMTNPNDCERDIDINLIRSMRFLCPSFDPDEEDGCMICYTGKTVFLEDFRKFLNEIVQGPIVLPEKWDLLDKTNWHLINPISSPSPRDLDIYYDHSISELYQWHTDENNLKYLLGTYPIPPKLSGQIVDASQHDLQFELYFPSDDWLYHFGEIIEFKTIEIKKSPLCRKPDVFEMKADIYVPEDQAKWYIQVGAILDPGDVVYHPYNNVKMYRFEVTMTGRFTNFDIAIEEPCYNDCKTLCNRPYLPGVYAEDDCEEILEDVAFANAQIRYMDYLKQKRKDFLNNYRATCMGVQEEFSGTRPYYEYQHTLYYYDQAGNLVKTVPPEGVDGDRLRQQPGMDEILDRVTACRNYVDPGISAPKVVPNHTLITSYQYNGINQLVEQNTPDGGRSRFWYDNLGRLIVSQNAKQAVQQSGKIKYSYTLYDDLGRLIEVGEVTKDISDPMTYSIANSQNDYANWLVPSTGTSRAQVTHTYYETAPVTISGFTPQNTRNRVVCTTLEEVYDGDDATYTSATHYSYDIHGNAAHVIQDQIALASTYNQRYKHIEYEYDLISGNANKVTYQKDKADQLIHKYTYDADNRLTEVETSLDDIIYRKEAKYFYYLHGPLARVELGNDNIQGLDYAYTIHGWLKSINGETITSERDIGQDGYTGSLNHSRFGVDAFGFMLHYYREDYASVGSFNPAEYFIAQHDDPTGGPSNATQHMMDLYNGNVMAMTTVLPKATDYASNYNLSMTAQMGVYRYDKLNRLKEMRVFNNYDLVQNLWKNDPGKDGMAEYFTAYTYDQNGNIKELIRHGSASQINMDHFTYNYDYTFKNPDGVTTSPYELLKTNKLYSVNDIISATNYSEDIDDMGLFVADDENTLSVNEAETQNNYQYDEIGNMIKDKAERIANIEWTLYGKIAKIVRETTGATHQKSDLEFKYGAGGNRIAKIEKPRDATGAIKPSNEWITTYYVRDASGNLMATYKEVGPGFNWESSPLYGTSRLGSYNPGKDLTKNEPAPITSPVVTSEGSYESGRKVFELSNHLGNVLAVITDRKIAEDPNSDNLVDYFVAEYTSITDYYPFGMQMKDRSWTAPAKDQQVQVDGGVLDLDQVGNALDIPAVTNINDEVTVELWFKHGASYNANEMIHDNFHGTTNANRGWIIDLSNGKIRFAVLNNPTATNTVYYTYPTSLLDNQWHHIALTIDNNDVYKYYIDGVLVHTQTGTGMMGSFSRNHISRLGARGGSPGPHTFVLYPFDGQLKQFAVWNTPRTAAEIATSYTNHVISTNGQMVYYYPCQEASGNNVVNQLTGTPATLTVPTVNLNWETNVVTTIISGTGGYRFGFQGQDGDKEIAGIGNSISYSYRIYDPRVGKFLSIDPLTRKYPMYSPYHFSSNQPIHASELEGLESRNDLNSFDPGMLEYRKKYGHEAYLAAVRAQTDVEITLEHVQTLFDVFGFVPVVGEVFDGANAAIYLANGDYLNAAFSMISLIPEVGDGIAKGVKYSLKAAGNVTRTFKGLSHAKTWVYKAYDYGVKYADEFILNSKKINNIKICGCFSKGTIILTDSGPIPIEDIKEGDLVWSYNEETSKMELNKVTSTFQTRFSQIYKITIDKNDRQEVFLATHEHPIYIDGNWITVDSLSVGDKLKGFNNEGLRIVAIDVHYGDYQVFNFEVDKTHNYFVGRQLRFLVHNGNPCKIITTSKPVKFGQQVVKREGKDLYVLGRVKQADVPGSATTGHFYNKGEGVNVLMTPIGEKTAKEFWQTVNKPWLDKAIKEGSDIRFIHDPRLAPDGSWLKKEYDYLIEKGYHLDEVSGYMVKN